MTDDPTINYPQEADDEDLDGALDNLDEEELDGWE